MLVAFDRQHQELVDSWIPWLDEHAAIREPVVLRRTLTIYGDVTKLTAPLGIKDRSTIALFLVDSAHTVRWAGRGPFRPDTAEDLERALRNH